MTNETTKFPSPCGANVQKPNRYEEWLDVQARARFRPLAGLMFRNLDASAKMFAFKGDSFRPLAGLMFRN